MVNTISSGGKLPYAKFLQRINGLKTYFGMETYI